MIVPCLVALALGLTPPAVGPAGAPEAVEPDAEPTDQAAPTETDTGPAPPPQFGTAGAKDSPTPPGGEPDFASAPGGYWGPTDTKDLPPADGRRKILIGSILAPLGLFSTASGTVFSYLFAPAHCVERTANAGMATRRSRCGGLFTLNVIRASYGGLMLVTGAVFFALGMRDRAQRREWDTHHTVRRRGARRFALTPTPSGLSLRF